MIGPGQIAGSHFLEKVGGWLASAGAEHATDLLGLAGMAVSSADKLRATMHPQEGAEPSFVGGEVGRNALDVGSLGLMALPSAAALHALARGRSGKGLAGQGDRLTNAVNLASLGALAIPGIDKIQARLRGGDDKRLLSEKAHEALEVGGLGGLSVGVAKNMLADRSRSSLLGGASLLGGYGTLAAPAVHGLLSSHDAEGSAQPHAEEGKWKKPLSELVGLGMLAAPSVAHMVGGHHG